MIPAQQNAQSLGELRVGEKNLVLGPISRILSTVAERRRGLHFSQAARKWPAPPLPGLRRTRWDATNPGLSDGPPSPLFSLAPDWVFRAAVVAFGAVGSYPTFSPLPGVSRLAASRTGRFILCDTVRHGALKRRAPSFAGNPALWCPDFPLRTVFSGRGITHALGSKNFGAKTWPQN